MTTIIDRIRPNRAPPVLREADEIALRKAYDAGAAPVHTAAPGPSLADRLTALLTEADGLRDRQVELEADLRGAKTENSVLIARLDDQTKYANDIEAYWRDQFERADRQRAHYMRLYEGLKTRVGAVAEAALKAMETAETAPYAPSDGAERAPPLHPDEEKEVRGLVSRLPRVEYGNRTG